MVFSASCMQIGYYLIQIPLKTMISNLPKLKWGIVILTMRKIIGKGSFGIVYQAVNQSNGQKYAVKQLFPTNSKSEAIMNEFLNCQNLKHCSIVKMYDMIQDPTSYYIIMEICDSQLSNKIESKRLTNDEIYNIMVETASGLRYMQALNVIHRDLKPENILLKGGKVKISDFGVSKRDEQTLQTNVGTPIYQAPEVANNSGSYSGKCDVFSLGIILYEMCYGKKPFRSSSWGALLEDVNKLKTRPFEFPAQPRIHELFKRLIQGCLVYDPDKRMSIVDVYYELRNYDWKQNTETLVVTEIAVSNSKQIKLKNKLSG